MSDAEIVRVWMHESGVQLAFEMDNSEVLIVDSVGQVSFPLIFQGPEWIEMHTWNNCGWRGQ